ncbi:MAG: hypothetical protein ACLQLC_15665 [Candidatus Sulfotelmatobacter sp.]
MRGIFQNAGLVLAGILLLALPAVGQLKFGEVSTDMNGTLATGYSGDYGNQIPSEHNLSVGGAATLNGSYYNPNFLSFTVSPYLNQARDNSSFQSISNASGVTASSNIFSGSHFPGSINYSKALNSEGNFAIPGVANYTTHGDSDSFGINWTEMVPNWPTLGASFQTGSSQYSIYGANDMGTTDYHSFNLRSGYALKGFNMAAFFSDGGGHSEFPEVLQSGTTTETTSSSNRSYGFNAGHVLPFHGSVAGAITRSDYNSYYAEGSNNGSVDLYTATANFQPTQKFHIALSTNYNSNLSGSLSEAIAGAAGGVAPAVNLGEGSHAMETTASGSYSVVANMQALGFLDHREQYYLGESYGSNSYGGGVTYWRLVFGGSLNTALTVSDNTVSTSNQNSLGLNGTINYNKHFAGWVAGVDFNYSQNVQTQLVSYTTSGYNYGANLRRRWGRFAWSGGGSASRTLLTEVAGSSNSAESFFTGIGYSRWITLSGDYAKSSGSAIQTGGGLVQNPIPQPLVPNSDLILFGGKSYSVSVSSNPMRRLTFGASYAKSITDGSVLGVTSSNDSKMINAIFQYQFRKMYLNGGYSNLVQGFSQSGLAPENISSFYIGVSRWFNFF